MEHLMVYFPVAGARTYCFLPPLIAFCLSFFTSMAGVSGAFLLLPYQMSVLGFTSPSVNSTNFLYNVIGTPGGVIRFIRERRMVWPLATTFVVGALPGILLGYYLRIRYLPDPRSFKFFVGLVLLGIGIKTLKGITTKPAAAGTKNSSFAVANLTASLRRVSYEFQGEEASFSVPFLATISFFIGIIGGIYGVSGGVILVPVCVSLLGLPIHTVAGAALLANFVASLAGVAFYSAIPMGGHTAPPDWPLGLLFGLGGLAGMYLGAMCQKHLPARTIKAGLAVIILLVAGRYIWQFFH